MGFRFEPASSWRRLSGASWRCVVHHEKGDRFGWCFQWDHDGAWELERATPNFDAALKAFTDGIERRDRGILSFLGIRTDWSVFEQSMPPGLDPGVDTRSRKENASKQKAGAGSDSIRTDQALAIPAM
jgi:hypothetical protein